MGYYMHAVSFIKGCFVPKVASGDIPGGFYRQRFFRL